MDVMTDQQQTPIEGDQIAPALQFSPEWIVSVVNLLQSVGDITVNSDTLKIAIATQRNLMVLTNSINTILNGLSQKITIYADDVAGWERDESGSLKVKEVPAAEVAEMIVESTPAEPATPIVSDV